MRAIGVPDLVESLNKRLAPGVYFEDQMILAEADRICQSLRQVGQEAADARLLLAAIWAGKAQLIEGRSIMLSSRPWEFIECGTDPAGVPILDDNLRAALRAAMEKP